MTALFGDGTPSWNRGTPGLLTCFWTTDTWGSCFGRVLGLAAPSRPTVSQKAIWLLVPWAWTPAERWLLSRSPPTRPFFPATPDVPSTRSLLPSETGRGPPPRDSCRDPCPRRSANTRRCSFFKWLTSRTQNEAKRGARRSPHGLEHHKVPFVRQQTGLGQPRCSKTRLQPNIMQ